MFSARIAGIRKVGGGVGRVGSAGGETKPPHSLSLSLCLQEIFLSRAPATQACWLPEDQQVVRSLA